MIEPIGHRVLLKMRELNQTTEAGIILPTEYHHKHQMAEMFGEVIALGEEAFITHKKKPKVGDMVIIPKHSGLLYTEDDVEYRVIDDTHIQGVIR